MFSRHFQRLAHGLAWFIQETPWVVLIAVCLLITSFYLALTCF